MHAKNPSRVDNKPSIPSDAGRHTDQLHGVAVDDECDEDVRYEVQRERVETVKDTYMRAQVRFGLHPSNG